MHFEKSASRLVGLVEHHVHPAPVKPGLHGLWVQLDHFREIRERLVELARVLIKQAPVDPRPHVLWVQFDGLGVVGDWPCPRWPSFL